MYFLLKFGDIPAIAMFFLTGGYEKSPLTDSPGKPDLGEKNLSHENTSSPGKRMPEVDARTT